MTWSETVGRERHTVRRHTLTALFLSHQPFLKPFTQLPPRVQTSTAAVLCAELYSLTKQEVVGTVRVCVCQCGSGGMIFLAFISSTGSPLSALYRLLLQRNSARLRQMHVLLDDIFNPVLQQTVN